MPRASFALAALALPILGCSAVEDPTATAASAIVVGVPDAEHGNVAAVGPRRTGCSEYFTPFCSGVLIAPDVVLTAAHCFARQPPWAVYEVMFGTDARRAGQFFYVVEIAAHPAYDARTKHADLALLRLAREVAPAPARLPEPGALDGHPGAWVTLVGFGQTSSADPSSSGQKRKGRASIGAVAPASFTVVPAPSLGCHGDSGGPAFAQADDNLLLGIASHGDPACEQDGVNVRVDAFLADFIRPYLARPRPAPRPALDGAGLCSLPCAVSSDCPLGLACVPAGGGTGRCLIEGLGPGRTDETCFADSHCGDGVCARVAAEDGADSCRCLSRCGASAPPAATAPAAGEPRADPAGADHPPPAGCALCPAAAGRATPAGALLLALSLLMLRPLTSRPRPRLTTNRKERT